MKNHPLVSIIIPCYNGEKLIERMLDSVIAQTYRPIELIIVNDGSTDNSDSVIQYYHEKFQKADITCKYITQENQGLGGAINTGLKHFSGEYLCWADIDDYYDENSILHRLEFLEDHSEYAVVTSNAYILDSNNLNDKKKTIASGVSDNENEYQFWNLLRGDSIFCSGSHMIRTRDFLDVNPSRSIYPARRGQNWQMLLPVYYKYKRYFLDEPLYNIIVYPNSMSRDITFEQMLYRCEEHEGIIFNTLKNIDMTNEDCKKAEMLVKEMYARRRMYLYAKNKMRRQACQQYKILKKLKVAKLKDWVISHFRIY